jgi:hypothetical protein
MDTNTEYQRIEALHGTAKAAAIKALEAEAEARLDEMVYKPSWVANGTKYAPTRAHVAWYCGLTGEAQDSLNAASTLSSELRRASARVCIPGERAGFGPWDLIEVCAQIAHFHQIQEKHGLLKAWKS